MIQVSKVEELIKKYGANHIFKDKYNRNMLHLLTTSPVNEDKIIEKAEKLLKAGCNINHQDKDQNTPLALAIRFKKEKLAIFFASQLSLDISYIDAIGSNYLITACECLNSKELITVLINRGVEQHAKNNNDFTPLATAGIFNHLAAIQAFYEQPNRIKAKSVFAGAKGSLPNCAIIVELYAKIKEERRSQMEELKLKKEIETDAILPKIKLNKL